MTRSPLALAACVLVVVAWVGLGVWREVARVRIERIAQAYRDYAAAHPESADRPPPVRWDFEQDRLVPSPPERAVVVPGEAGPAGSPRTSVALVREDEAPRSPAWLWGLYLARVPAWLFHGVFALLALATFAAGRRAR
jgi:hypothetical protein